MTAFPLVNWALVALSLINTTLLLWLGLMILLNAERPTWGVWMSSTGMLIGSVFFMSHTAILGRGVTAYNQSINFWWYIGLLAAIVLPYLWYVAMLWYNGYWVAPDSRLRRRHRLWVALATLCTIAVVALLLRANPFRSFSAVISLQLAPTPELFGVPALIWLYGFSILLTIGGSVDALRHPGPARRLMGEQARERARPWLTGAALMLLVVTLLICAVMVGVITTANRQNYLDLISMEWEISMFDLVISACITLAVFFQGQAITRYEVFTGKSLPQRRLARHWRNVLILSVSYGVVMSAVLTLDRHPIYLLIVMALLMIGGYTWFSQNSYQERERYLNHLRPFLTSQHLYSHLTAPATPAEVELRVPFEALCHDILNAEVAYLAAFGPLAPLVGPPLAYPADQAVPSLTALEVRRETPTTLSIPVSPAQYGGARWAIPLWSERGLIGVLLLGNKFNGGLYVQEEIEIARASGERLIDTRASAEMSRRLMELQRQRLAESSVIDSRARRVLHDDILPRLHETMLVLSALNGSGGSTAQEAITLLGGAHRDIANLLQDMPIRIAPEIARDGLIESLRRMVVKEFPSAFDEVVWEVGTGCDADLRALPPLTGEVLYYAAREAVRNAAKHGRSPKQPLGRPFRLTIGADCEAGARLVIADNGVGLAVPAQGRGGTSRPITPKGSGNGLALHSTMMAVIGGTLTLDSSGDMTSDGGVRVELLVPHSASHRW